MKTTTQLTAGIAAFALLMPASTQTTGPAAAAVATTTATTIQKRTLSLEGARTVIAAAIAEAKRTNSGGVIAVVDDGGNTIALERLDGTFPAGATISIGKARTAALFQRPTRFFEDVIKNGRTAMVALNDFTPLMGGVPVLVDGQMVGAVGVSGATSAQRDDEIATAGAAALGGTTAMTSSAAPTPPVIFYESAKVAASFTTGSVLFDGASTNRNYRIDTSRRDKPGQAEVHQHDTDLIYVQEGTCTFVTGGTVVGGKSIAADEVRGDMIQGGEVRKLAKGDVVIVPAGTPHWFRDVTGPVTYYTVKVH